MSNEGQRKTLPAPAKSVDHILTRQLTPRHTPGASHKSFDQLVQQVGPLVKQASPEQRAAAERAAALDRQRYDREHADYVGSTARCARVISPH